MKNPRHLRILMIFSIGIFVQFLSWAQSGYNDYSALDKTFRYREDFSKPSSRWESNVEGKSTNEIRGGALVFGSVNDKAQAKYTRIEGLDWTGDWQIEIGVRWVNGKENSSVDLIWDRTPGQTRKYHFGFTAARKYNISEYNQGYQQIVGFTKADFVYKTTRNRLTVRHIDGYYYFFVNERFVKKHPSKTITGNYIGFMVPPSSVIEVDYLYVHELKEPSGSRSTSTANSDSRSESRYVAVMTKNTGYNLQRWKTRDNFPKDEIKSDWNDGFSISDLSYDNGKWSLIMSKGTGYSTQTWLTRREWKKEEVKAKWDEGYKITEVNYGNGVYAMVFSKTEALGRQRWATKISSFPSDKIREFGNDGLKISDVIYGKDRWLVVAAEDSRIKNQKWFKRAKFPAEDIETYTLQGYTITQLSREENWWVLIMSQYYSGDKPTVWFRSKDFPKDEIREYWDQGYYLTDLTYFKSSGRAKESDYNTNNKSTETTFKVSNLKTNLLGDWYGGADGEEKGYMRFYSDDIIRMISGTDTIGGYNYKQEGVKLEVKYELNSFNTPNQLDLVFYASGKSFGRMKGIIRFINKDTFEFKLASVLNDPRPTSFKSNADNTVTTFRRVK